jgi:membrane dipeptidase
VIVDGHNDLVSRVWREEEILHVHLEHAQEADFVGGFFALFVPSPPLPAPTGGPSYALPLPDPISQEEAARIADEMYEILRSLPIELATSADDFRPGRVTAILHLEGAEPLAPDLSGLDEWYERGLRSIGLTWSRANAFAEGVPFRFPSTGDTGPGLTAAGKELVRRCNELGILVDLSHLNEAGFWDVAALSSAPLVATHSNVNVLCASSRNLTDAQLDAVGASGGVVGINFAVSFLREDGHNDADTPLTEIVRHAEYIARRIGVEHVALGSDFDGALVPAELDGIAALPKLVDAFRAAGWDEQAVEKVTHANWLRVLRETWR